MESARYQARSKARLDPEYLRSTNPQMIWAPHSGFQKMPRVSFF
jgi:hypothetical protein